MSITQQLLEWTNSVLTPLGPFGLFVIAFIESSFFPIPPDLILIGLVLISPNDWIFLSTICTIGSVAGALFGYFIGIKGGRPLLLKFTKEHRAKKVEDYFTRYGDWAVAIAAFTPVPYKVFTIASGVFKYSWVRMALVSIPARGARFFLIGGVLAFYGQTIMSTLDLFLGPISLIVAVAAIAGYLLYKRHKKKKLNSQVGS